MLFNCEHPKVVTNKYTGEKLSVRCGKCNACLNARAANWTTRLDLECKCHRYVVFATLTYADNNLPQFVRLRSCDVQNPSDICYIDSSTGEMLDFMHKSISRHSPKDFQYCRDTKVLNVLRYSDNQKFIKLLRYYARKIDKDAKIRFYASLEYGPTTFRPHAHYLFFYDSPRLDGSFIQILSKSWKYGNIYDPHYVTGSASSYCASYLTCSSNLPSIYLHKAIRPAKMFSKLPSIGSLFPDVQKILRLADGETSKFTANNANNSKFIDVPLWSSLQYRLYPRLPRFNFITHRLRVELYNLATQYEFDTAEKFAEFLYVRYVRYAKNTELGRYFSEIVTTYERKLSIGFNGRREVSDHRTTLFSPLVRFCRIISRVAVNASQLNISITDYVSKIENFYENLDKNRLTEYYKNMDEYFKSHPIRDYLFFDYAFVERVNGKIPSLLPVSDKFYLLELGLVDDFNSDTPINLSLSDLEDYRALCARHAKIAYDNSKVKYLNDYLLSHKDNYQNIINFYQSID